MCYTGILSPLTPVKPLLQSPTVRPQSHRHFSAFPLTSHLHTPYLRLISLHPHLTLAVSFLRVPQIHDGFRWTVYLARSTTAEEVLAAIVDEFGLSKAMDGPGGGNIDYVLEEVWQDGEAEGMVKSLFPLVSQLIDVQSH